MRGAICSFSTPIGENCDALFFTDRCLVTWPMRERAIEMRESRQIFATLVVITLSATEGEFFSYTFDLFTIHFWSQVQRMIIKLETVMKRLLKSLVTFLLDYLVQLCRRFVSETERDCTSFCTRSNPLTVVSHGFSAIDRADTDECLRPTRVDSCSINCTPFRFVDEIFVLVIDVRC